MRRIQNIEEVLRSFVTQNSHLIIYLKLIEALYVDKGVFFFFWILRSYVILIRVSIHGCNCEIT